MKILIKKNNTLKIIKKILYGVGLFYAFKDGCFYFSSEPRQITLLLDCQPNYCSILSFLREGDFNSNGQTFFEEIQEFPSASVLIINSEGSVKFDKFWNYPLLGSKRTTKKTFLDFEILLKDAVKIRLQADVPFGSFLSGGIDSALVSGIAAKISKEPIKTFSIGFDDPKYDESKIDGKFMVLKNTLK